MLGRLVAETARREGHGHPWGNILPELWKSDLFLINLECALTSETAEWTGRGPKPFHFRADPDAAQTLRLGGVDFAALANNHIGDYGMAGLAETLTVLDQAGIAHAGAGPTLDAARAPARLRAGRWRVHVLAAADHPSEWAAGTASPGIHYVPVSQAPEDFTGLETAIRAARRNADLVILSMHWGPNMRSAPTEAFRAFARRTVAAGVDLFWGHSAHVVQGVEVSGNGLILYDTGDLVDDYMVESNLRNDWSALFQVHLLEGGLRRLTLVPIRISNMQANLATGIERTRMLERFRILSAGLGTELRPGPEGLSIDLDHPRVASTPS
jgi:poly-gamma-glutamate synthesis protein (capsule biosynthesis protein)